MRYLAFVLALWHVGCAENDIAVEGCGITPGGCCEVVEDCTVLGEVQTCLVDECVCNTPTTSRSSDRRRVANRCTLTQRCVSLL